MFFECWGIGNAFLQGLSFANLKEKARALGYEVNCDRTNYIRPPAL